MIEGYRTIKETAVLWEKYQDGFKSYVLTAE